MSDTATPVNLGTAPAGFAGLRIELAGDEPTATEMRLDPFARWAEQAFHDESQQ
jgi:hypothetical protein